MTDSQIAAMKAEIEAQAETIEQQSDTLQKLRRELIDLSYMTGALTDMLGPNGLAVWKMWNDQGVRRVHYSWGPKAKDMTGEERAAHILAMESAPKELVHNVDGVAAPIAGE